MKKITIITFSLIMCLGITACGKKTASNNAPAVPQGGLEVKENNTLLGWLKKGKAIECEVLSPSGRVTVKSKNEAVRMEGIPFFSPDSAGTQPSATNGVLLSANGWTYMWDQETKKGTKINNAEIARLNGDESAADVNKDWNEMVQEWDETQVGYDCKEATLSDELFTEPVGIEFTDLTEILTGAESLMGSATGDLPLPEMPGNIDMKDLEIPAGANQEEIEAILEDRIEEAEGEL